MERFMISVILATYNGEKYISEQLGSVLDQTVLPDEIIIGDDASGDHTVQAVKEVLEKKNADGRVKVTVLQREQNLGYRENFFRLISEAKGDLIFLCDQDDIWASDKIESMVRFFDTHPEGKALSTSFHVIDGEGKRIKQGKNSNAEKKVTRNEFLRYPAYPGMTMAFRKEIAGKVSARFHKHKAMHDWAVNYVAASEEGMYYLEQPLTSYRRHGGNVSAMMAAEQKDSRKNKRVALIQELIDNMTEADESGLKEFIAFEKKRMELLQQGSIFRLLFFELGNLKYTKLKPIFGDLYAIL